MFKYVARYSCDTHTPTSLPIKMTLQHQMRSQSRRGAVKVIVFLVTAVTLCGAAGYAWWNSEGSGINSASDMDPLLYEVQSGPFDHIVLEQGEIESSANNEVKCEVKGRGSSGTPILTLVAEGVIVKKGDNLCQLDSSALDQDAKNQRIVVSTVESNLIGSEAAVSKAAIAKQEYLDGTYLTEQKAILSEIALAQQGLRKAELSLQSAERLAQQYGTRRATRRAARADRLPLRLLRGVSRGRCGWPCGRRRSRLLFRRGHCIGVQAAARVRPRALHLRLDAQLRHRSSSRRRRACRKARAIRTGDRSSASDRSRDRARWLSLRRRVGHELGECQLRLPAGPHRCRRR